MPATNNNTTTQAPPKVQAKAKGKGKNGASSSSSSSSSSKVFANCKIGLAGTLGGDWTYANVARWTAYNGGEFSNGLDDKSKKVTHVLATPGQYNAKLPTVKKALKAGAYVVTKDWFEDSLTKKRRLNELDYSLKNADIKANAKKALDAKIQKGIEEGKTFVNTNLYHVYRDETYFRYEITLTRDDKETGNVGQKYQLFLWESNAWPHLYVFAAKYYKKPRDNRPTVYRPRDDPVELGRGLADFKRFFYQKTGLRWDDRVAGAGTTEKSKFQYTPPTGGKPIGVLEPQTDRRGTTLVGPASRKRKESPVSDPGSGSGGNEKRVCTEKEREKSKSHGKGKEEEEKEKVHQKAPAPPEKPAGRKRKGSPDSFQSSGSEEKRLCVEKEENEAVKAEGGMGKGKAAQQQTSSPDQPVRRGSHNKSRSPVESVRSSDSEKRLRMKDDEEAVTKAKLEEKEEKGKEGDRKPDTRPKCPPELANVLRAQRYFRRKAAEEAAARALQERELADAATAERGELGGGEGV
ncbi:hypothetical protein F4811DRAFT_551727 [Daldinia bambusicola]|nr:hypothetical protein F4811DRAFT_551727 [Daldinia bambusicola]